MQYITIGGASRPVKYTINALLEFEELTGIDLISGSPEERARLTKLKNVRALAFVGLKHGAKAENKALDFELETVGDWLSLHDGSFNNIVSSYRKDMGATGADAEQKEEEPAEKN